MRKGVVLACGGAALVVSGVLGWIDVRRERDFRRLLAEGDRALAAGQTPVAVEAFSGAVALKPQSMLPYLKRGDTYLHRQEWTAADRDLRSASALDPTAPQPRERRGDVALGEGRFVDATRDYRESLALEDRAPGASCASWPSPSTRPATTTRPSGPPMRPSGWILRTPTPTISAAWH